MTSRTLRITAADNITIEGLTRGPAHGWALVNDTLTHPASPNGFHLTPQAADRVRDAAARAVPAKPATYRELTGYQIGQLPADEAADFRSRCEYVGTRHGVHGVYRVQLTDPIPGQPVEITLDRSDLR